MNLSNDKTENIINNIKDRLNKSLKEKFLFAKIDESSIKNMINFFKSYLMELQVKLGYDYMQPIVLLAVSKYDPTHIIGTYALVESNMIEDFLIEQLNIASLADEDYLVETIREEMRKHAF